MLEKFNLHLHIIMSTVPVTAKSRGYGINLIYKKRGQLSTFNHIALLWLGPEQKFLYWDNGPPNFNFVHFVK